MSQHTSPRSPYYRALTPGTRVSYTNRLGDTKRGRVTHVESDPQHPGLHRYTLRLDGVYGPYVDNMVAASRISVGL